jgi:hypothetical protein
LLHLKQLKVSEPNKLLAKKMLPYPITQNRAMRRKKTERTHLVNEDLSWERREGIKARRPPPHEKLPPVSLPLHENIPKTNQKQNLEIAAKRAEEESAHRKSDVGARGAREAGGGGRGGEGRRRGGDAEATRLHGKGKQDGKRGKWSAGIFIL